MEIESQSRSIEAGTRSYNFTNKRNNNNNNNKNKKQIEMKQKEMKRNKPHHPGIFFNGNPVKNSSYLKHLGMFLDSKLDFNEHIKGLFDKTSTSVGLIRKLQNFLPGPSLLQIYKSLLRPNLDYNDVIYSQVIFSQRK